MDIINVIDIDILEFSATIDKGLTEARTSFIGCIRFLQSKKLCPT